MAKILEYKNGAVRVQYEPGKEFAKRHITPALIAKIDEEGKSVFSNDPLKKEIYYYLAAEIADRCFPVMSRKEIVRLVSNWDIYANQDEYESRTGEEDGHTLSDGRVMG